ncbi:MAG: ComF family protein [Endomicrobium sp.]|jgi:ComF family protein|nr:ComF family protein [Endomicrobium sp.]
MIKEILLRIINFIYPITCCLCGKDLEAISQYKVCDKCKESFSKIKGNICDKCGISLDSEESLCYVCKKDLKAYSFDKLRAVYLYKGNLRKLVLKFKYSNRIFLYKDFAFEMSNLIKEYNFLRTADFIIPVPLNIFRRIKRGYNQAELLAQEVSVNIGIPMLKNVLLRGKVTKPQFKLSKFERKKNIQSSFTIKNKNTIKNKTILIVDDIATTCSTVSVCAGVLKRSGAKNVYVLTLARD